MANGTELETNKNICVGFFVTQISQMTQIFIHRMTRNLFGGIPAEAINHGFSQRRSIRSVQIPLKKDLSRQGELDAQTEVLCRRRITAA